MNLNAAVIIALSLMASRFLGVLREVLLANIAGVNTQKNALDLAFLIPDLLNHVVSTGFLSMIFIPLFTGYLVQKQENKAWRFFSNILNSLGFFLLALMLPAWIWMREAILFFTASNPSPDVLDLAVRYGRIILPGQIAFFAGSFFVAVQHTRRQFLIPSLTGVIYNVAIVAGGWLGRAHGIEGFAWGVPVGAVVGFLILQFWGMQRSGFHWEPIVNYRDPDLRRYLHLMFPLMLGVGAMFALEFVIKSFGSGFGSQGISALNYAYRLMYTLVAVFGFSVGVASYPEMARLAKEGLQSELNRKVALSIDRMFAILVPTLVAVALVGFAAVRILFERGAFSRESTELVSELLRWYLPASLGLCLQAVLVRSFYAQERMWTPTLINTSLFLLSLFCYGPAAARWGIFSVPLVGAITSLLQIGVLAYAWHKINGFVGVGESAQNFLKSIGALVIMGGVVYSLDPHLAPFLRYWPMSTLVPVAALAGALAFVLTLGLQIALGSQSARQLAYEKGKGLMRRLAPKAKAT